MPYKDDTEQKAAQKAHYQKNKDKYYARMVEARNKRRAWLAEYKESRGCLDCGKDYPHYVLDFDHRNPENKVMNVSLLVNYGWPKLRAEVIKCDVVCSNCHRIRTHS